MHGAIAGDPGPLEEEIYICRTQDLKPEVLLIAPGIVKIVQDGPDEERGQGCPL